MSQLEGFVLPRRRLFSPLAELLAEQNRGFLQGFGWTYAVVDYYRVVYFTGVCVAVIEPSCCDRQSFLGQRLIRFGKLYGSYSLDCFFFLFEKS